MKNQTAKKKCDNHSSVIPNDTNTQEKKASISTNLKKENFTGGYEKVVDTLAVMDSDVAEYMNTILIRSQNYRFHLNSEEYEFAFDWQPDSISCNINCVFLIKDTFFEVGMERSVFGDIYDLDKLEDLLMDIKLLYMEVLLEDICQVLESLFTAPVRINSINTPRRYGKDKPTHRIHFNISRVADGQKSAGFIATPLTGLRLLAQRMNIYPPIENLHWDHTPILLWLEIGRIQLALNDFRGIEAQDVIIFYRVGDGEDKIPCRLRVAQGYYLDCAWNTHNTIVIGKQEEDIMPEIDGDLEMEQQTWGEDKNDADYMPDDGSSVAEGSKPPLYEDHLVQDRQDPPLANMDELPIELVFEVGTCTVSLKEFKCYRQGSILRTHQQEQTPITIRANGRKIGGGELVRLDGQLGVRVLELFNNV